MNKKHTLRDSVASRILNDEDCREYVVALIAAALEVDKEVIEKGLVLKTDRVTNNVNIQNGYADSVYENDEAIINIEINYNNNGNYTMIKNAKYIYQLFLNQLPKNKKINNIKKINQININNYDYYKKGEFVYRSYIMDEKYHIKRNDFISIIDINVDFLNKIEYTKIKEKRNSLEYLLYLFANNNKEELEEVYKGDEVMEEVKEKVSALTDDFMDELYYDRDELKLMDAYDVGTQEATREIVKKMIQQGISMETIVKITDLSPEEIEEIKQETD